jgi:hypothetical protein
MMEQRGGDRFDSYNRVYTRGGWRGGAQLPRPRQLCIEFTAEGVVESECSGEEGDIVTILLT